MQVSRWRNLMMLKNALVPTFSQSTIPATKTRFASIHSTATTCDKWKNKLHYDGRKFRQQQKNEVRYAIRQRRADTKRALKDLLFNSGGSQTSFQDADPFSMFEAEHSNATNKKKQFKSAQHAKKSHAKRMRSKSRRESLSEDYDDSERVFEARFGNRWYTWTFNDYFFRGSTPGFEWRKRTKWTNHRTNEWETSSETDSDDESFSVGSCSDRKILGLPLTGPLKIDDVKNAFRLSALKWHPDKNQGPSQAMAAEKFKHCVNAYKSLCNALS